MSSDNQQSSSDTDFTSSEYPPLSDVLHDHLTGCEQCQNSLKGKPVPNLNPTGSVTVCSEWFQILRDYAEREGRVNNIVRHDEYGNYAHGSKGEL